MPELPEVETIRSYLQPKIQNQQIEKSQLKLPRLLLGSSPLEFKKSIQGQSIQQVLRRGKYLILELSHSSLVFHLGMTGQLTLLPFTSKPSNQFQKTLTGLQVSKGGHAPDKHTHFTLFFSSGDQLHFRDVRTFGKLIYLKEGDWHSHPRLKKLGIEPLELKPVAFLKKHSPITSQRTIKSLLLDQSFICGVGNIYCDEALFEARIQPQKKASQLTTDEWKTLLKAVIKVIKKGIRNSGTTFSDYRQPDHSKGSNQEQLRVYGRGGAPCYQCTKILKKITVAQRGTVFCPHCQK